ncbi:MAG: hypothetical protein H6Q89_237, partial [Myxococcaceae bacterium]|nr:hypothetical protein [Myxococcaceae bacterium]
FILLSMTGLATFGILNVNAPNYGAAAGAGDDSQDKPPLLLTVAISPRGFYLAATGGVLPGAEGAVAAAPGEGVPTVAKLADGAFDYPALNNKMKEIKTAFPTESKVIIAADKDIQYEVLVMTMDALRETSDHKLLFPDVTLGSF